MITEIPAGVRVKFVPPEPDEGEIVLVWYGDPYEDVPLLVMWGSDECESVSRYGGIPVKLETSSVREWMRIPSPSAQDNR